MNTVSSENHSTRLLHCDRIQNCEKISFRETRTLNVAVSAMLAPQNLRTFDRTKRSVFDKVVGCACVCRAAQV